MQRGQAAAIGVHRKGTAGCRALAGDKIAAFADLAETQRLQRQQDRDGETVVDLHHVNVGMAYTGHFHRGFAGLLRRQQTGKVGHLCDGPMGVRLAIALDRNGFGPEVLGAFGGGHNDGARAVGDKAAVEQVQRFRDHRAGQNVVDGQRIAPRCGGVQLRPFPGGDGDLGKVLGSGAVFVHVPLRRHRVAAHRRRHPIGGFVLHRQHRWTSAQIAAAQGFLVGAVNDQRNLAIALAQCHRGVGDMRFKGRAADIGTVNVGRHDAQIFAQRYSGELSRPRHAPHAGGQKTIDIIQRQTGFFDGGLCHQCGMAQDRRLGDEFPILDWRVGKADDHRVASVLHMLFLPVVPSFRCGPDVSSGAWSWRSACAGSAMSRRRWCFAFLRGNTVPYPRPAAWNDRRGSACRCV